MAPSKPAPHPFHVVRIGDVDQVLVRDGADLAALASLDPTNWVAVAMPTRGTELDDRTLDLLDTDHDGRVRLPEVRAAIDWARPHLASLDELLDGSDTIPLDRLAEGPLAAGARRVLAILGRADAKSIALADVADEKKLFAGTKLNGDGVVTPLSTDDAALAQTIRDVIATHGAVADRSGEPGIDAARIDAFFTEVKALAAWDARATAEPALRPVGERSEAAARAVAAVRAKIDDYFARCRLAAWAARETAALGAEDSDLAALSTRELSPSVPELSRLPLARPAAARPLPLRDGLSPAWSDAVRALVDDAIVPVLGPRDALDEPAWRELCARLEPCQAWIAARPTVAVDKLGLERVRVLAQADAPGGETALRALLAADTALTDETAQVAHLERLLRYRRDFRALVDNFVNFTAFYRRRGATFQAGDLIIDGRRASLCIEVNDAAKHAALAAMAGVYLLYCDVSRLGEKKTIVAAISDGDGDNLFVGRNGLFIDRRGRDWDATVTRIVANPISLREAFFSPYKKAVRFVEDMVSKRAAAADAAAEQRLQKSATSLGEAADGKAAAPPPADPNKGKIEIGTIAAIGVALGGIGAMVTGIMSAFFGLGAWMPLGLLGVVLAISGPSMLIAWLKLRRRNLGPLLDANGWAINGRVRINVPFGRALTRLARVPDGASRTLDDPYSEKRGPFRAIAVVVLIGVLGGLWLSGRLDRWLPERFHGANVLAKLKP